MCATVIWAINAAAYSTTMARATERRLGVAPQPTDFRIASERVRSTAVHFTLTRRMCDCDGLVGLGDRPVEPGETSASDLVGWLHELPSFAPHVTRLAVLRSWNPTRHAVAPTREREVAICAVDEPLLRGISDDHLVTIDYPTLDYLVTPSHGR